MSDFVVGFDIGTVSSYIVIGENGSVASVANEYSDRNTPTYVSFSDKMCFTGMEAKQQQITNIFNTIYNFTKFLGKMFNDPIVQKEITEVPFKVISTLNNRVGFEVTYLNKKQIFTPEQILAIHLTKLKEIAEMNLSRSVKDIVINIATASTESEHQAILEASKIADLNCIAIVNDTNASSLAYGIYSDDIPFVKVVAFIDIGYSHCEANIVRFKNGIMTILASTCEQVGGRNFDNVIYKKMKKDILKKYQIRVVDVSKPGLRLKQECEKLKKMMNVNTMEIPLNIDCFMNDVDISSKMSRAEFEELSSEILLKIRNTLKYLLRKAKLAPKEIDSVEIIGGSSRIQSVKQVIAEIFMKEARTSLNADESVARGCALKAALIAHPAKVNRYKIEDISLQHGKSLHKLTQHTPESILQFIETEKRIQSEVKAEKEKLAVKNSVEEFIYDHRERIQQCDSSEEKKESILLAFESTENWLYGEGEDVSKQEYLDKLDLLKNLTKTI